jgi:hypothetical protein
VPVSGGLVLCQQLQPRLGFLRLKLELGFDRLLLGLHRLLFG